MKKTFLLVVLSLCLSMFYFASSNDNTSIPVNLEIKYHVILEKADNQHNFHYEPTEIFTWYPAYWYTFNGSQYFRRHDSAYFEELDPSDPNGSLFLGPEHGGNSNLKEIGGENYYMFLGNSAKVRIKSNGPTKVKFDIGDNLVNSNGSELMIHRVQLWTASGASGSGSALTYCCYFEPDSSGYVSLKDAPFNDLDNVFRQFLFEIIMAFPEDWTSVEAGEYTTDLFITVEQDN